MNPDLLERLALDRALGHLSPDVEALLDEVLAANPDAARMARDFRETVQLAAAVLPKPARGESLPPRRVETFPFVRVSQWAALAASFVLGVGSTLLVPAIHREPQIVRQAAPTMSAIEPKAIAPEIERKARTMPFWSAQRAYLLASSAKTTGSTHERKN